MNVYTTTHWTPPLKRSSKGKRKAPKQVLVKSQLYTIDEENKNTSTPFSLNSLKSEPIHEDLAALMAFCDQLESKLKSSEAIQNSLTFQLHTLASQHAELEQKHSKLETKHSSLKKHATELSAHKTTLEAQLETLKRQNAEAWQALELTLSSTPTPPPNKPSSETPVHQLEIQIQELTSRNRTLEERCQSLSAWGDLHRMSASKIESKLQLEQQSKQASEDKLLEALSNADRQHSALQSEHARLQATHQSLQNEHSALLTRLNSQNPNLIPTTSTQDNTETKQRETIDALTKILEETKSHLHSTETRAATAERSIQRLLSAQVLLKSTPISPSLLSRATSILQSTTSILAYAKSNGQLLTCVDDVCSALAALDDDLSSHSATASAWLAKRDLLIK